MKVNFNRSLSEAISYSIAINKKNFMKFCFPVRSQKIKLKNEVCFMFISAIDI